MASTPPPAAAVAETHISWVFFTSDRAFKILKPIRTEFLDYSSMELRARACHREVALNCRLSPDVYLGVSPILERGEVVDHMIVMRRLPSSRRLSALAGSDELVDRVREVARVLAHFHASLPADPGAARVARVGWLRQLWTAENLDQMTAQVRDGRPVHDPGLLAEVRQRALDYLDARDPLFEARIAQGHVVDGHGDLLADDIFCLPDGPRILDCLAFDDDLRRGDVLADLAFLAMDLEALPGGSGAADELVRTYDELTAEHHPRSLLHFYVAQRALVRAKVRGLRSLQGDDDQCREAAAEARLRLHQCLDHLRAATVRLVLVGGAPGTGKTTVAAAVADALGATTLSSDELRKDLEGVARSDHRGASLDHGLYAPEVTERTYRELMRRAEHLLHLGESVVLDASWTTSEHRTWARQVAVATHSELHELRCELDPAVASERVARRLGAPEGAAAAGASDATPGIARALAARAEPWTEALTLDTSGERGATLAAALELLGIPTTSV
jgi:aminoglycoside phosphotransferase family enzyme/predicted kinase